jgi:D-glycero-alpha-D-manno-heptose-7-phosphate kinase
MPVNPNILNLNETNSLKVNFSPKVIDHNCSTKSFLEKIQKEKRKVFFVTDNNNKFIGAISEGDFRRFVINNGNVPETVYDIINRSAYYISENDLKSLSNTVIDLSKGEIPVLNEQNEIIDFYPNTDSYSLSKNLKLEIVAIAPTRISFAGGGSDLNYWFEKNRGCVVNLAISKYARVSIVRNFTRFVKISSLNTGEKIKLDINDLRSYKEKKLYLVVKCLLKCHLTDGIDINIFCDFEPGTGLGGSSSLTVAIITGLSKLFHLEMSNQKLAEISYDIERNDAGISGGWQDQIAAVNGGLCISNFSALNIKTHKINLSQKYEDYLNSSLFISRIGGSRKSSKIHSSQEAVSKEISYKSKMKSIVELADKCASLIGEEKIDELGKILDEGWHLKKSLGDFISSKEIDERYYQLLNFGAQGGRLLGAGGSGFILVNVDPVRQGDFLNKCKSNLIPIERIEIDTLGARTL